MEEESRGEFDAGDIFGGYTVVRRLGGGSFGEVYEAVNKLGYRVAIKTLRREHAQRGDLRARFLREGLSAVKIRHPNAVQVIDAGEERDIPYLVMELLKGEDLEALLARAGALSPTRAVDLLLPAMAAVVAAHDEGVIHRDLKPANLFLSRTRDGEVIPKVVDFGISRLKAAPEDGLLTRDDALMGSPAYMSPEQTRGARDVGEASDQFSLAVILYECVTGQPAFSASSLHGLLLKVSQAEYPLPRMVRPTLPVDFETLLVRAMAVDPASRYPSVRAFGCALLPFASSRVRANVQRVFDPLGATTVAWVQEEGAQSSPRLSGPPIPPVSDRAATSGSIVLPMRRIPKALWGGGLAVGVVVLVGVFAVSAIATHTGVAPSATVVARSVPAPVTPLPTATSPAPVMPGPSMDPMVSVPTTDAGSMHVTEPRGPTSVGGTVTARATGRPRRVVPHPSRMMGVY